MSRSKHESSIIVDEDYSVDGPTFVLKCECGWKHVVMQEYDRYAGRGFPVTLEELWAVWMMHLGSTR